MLDLIGSFGSALGNIGSSIISSAASMVPSVGGDLLSSHLNYKYNKRLQDRAFKHQIKMYKHAHQWEVNDLRKAGLNPILSAGGNSAFASAPMTSVSVPSFGDNFINPIDNLVKLQGFSSARDAQMFARENHEIDLATKEAQLAGLEAQFLKDLAEIDSIQSNSALNQQLFKARDNDTWSDLQTIGPLMSAFSGGHSSISSNDGVKSVVDSASSSTTKTTIGRASGRASGKAVSGSLSKSLTDSSGKSLLLDPESIFSGVGRLYYLNKFYGEKPSKNFLTIEKKMPKSVFTRYKYRYHNKK